jgi:hypothetical protein
MARRLLWALTVAAPICSASCTETDSAPVRAQRPSLEEAVVLRVESGRVSADSTFQAGGGAIEVEFREVHSSPRPEDAAPYVRVGDGWLELHGAATIVSGGRVYRVRRGNCETEDTSFGDYSITSIVACEVFADELDAPPPTFATGADAASFVATERRGTLETDARGSIVAVRSTGFDLGKFDASLGGGKGIFSIVGGLDIITAFGVKSLDFDEGEEPFVGHEESFELGPQRIFVTIGNTSRNCVPDCLDMYSFTVKARPLDGAPKEAPAYVLEYL